MINVLGLVDHDKQVINESFKALSEKYECTLENDQIDMFTNKIYSLKLLKMFTTTSIKNIFEIHLKGRSFYIISIYLANFRERLEPRVHIYGFMTLKKDMGDIHIRPETIWDKIGDIFNKRDIDIPEHKGFSDKYCLFAKDRDFAKSNLPVPFLEEVYQLKKLHMTFEESIMLATFNNKIQVNETMELAGFMERISQFFA